MDFAEWFTAWLSRHPLKSPSEADRSRFTADVMARVRTETAVRPAAGWAASFSAGWPRFALPLAAAAVLVAVHVRRPAEARLVAEVTQHTEMLAELGEPLESVLPADAEELAEDLEREDLMVLAEAQPESDDATWIADSMKVLEEIDETLPDEGTAGTGNDEQWLKELETLDQSELASQS